MKRREFTTLIGAIPFVNLNATNNDINQDKYKLKVGEFKGRIVPSIYDFQTTASDVIGAHQVWYPRNKTDVAVAIALFEGQKIFIRSGTQVTKQDMVDGTDSIVINLIELTNVTIVLNEVKAEAGATIEQISVQLAKHGLALPLSDNPLRSIVSNAIHGGPLYLMRSLCPLSDYIEKIHAVRPDGSQTTFQECVGTTCIDQCLAANATITQIDFKAASAEGLWMYQKTCLYPGKDHFLKTLRALFADAKLSKSSDLVLDAFNGQHTMPFIRISAIGTSEDGKEDLEQLIEEVFAEIQSKLGLDIMSQKWTGGAVITAIADSGFSPAPDPTIDSERIHNVIEADEAVEDFIIQYVEYVHRGIAFGDHGEGKLNDDLYLASRIQLNRNDGLEFTGYAYTPNFTIENPSATRSSSVLLKKTIPFPSTLPPAPIPGFKGDVYRQKDKGYKSRAKQYATSSYPKAQMTPFMVAYPRDEEDISAAIAFAKANIKRIVVRSGGHQYSGKSSGGSNTIVLSMDAFDHLRILQDFVEVGPAVRLTLLAKRFKQQSITIPHGECPFVAIGGHTQTGGYGHLLRSFGLIMDFVLSFDIVLADGSRHTISRPLPHIPPSTAEEKLKREIFWGVLGGNAGSFGIVTNYKFEFIKDRDHPNSYGFSAKRKFKKHIFYGLMKEAQKWTKKIEDGTLPAGIDFMMTVESPGRVPFPPLIVELLHANLGGKQEAVNGEQTFHSIIEAASSEAALWERPFIKSHRRSLSKLSDVFVRRWPETDFDGREFNPRYKKRVNCSMRAITDDFVEKLVEMLNHVIYNRSGVKLVFQMSFGGGAYQHSERRLDTSISHRDYVFCLVFDLFYKKGYEETANELQLEMQHLIDNHFSQDQERRFFWGSFGDTDISKQEIKKMYYDSEEQYARLQNLKKQVDPDDVFHTNLTVKLPE